MPRPTVKELKKFLEDNKIPDDFLVTGYEGEGGSWVLFQKIGVFQVTEGKDYFEFSTRDENA